MPALYTVQYYLNDMGSEDLAVVWLKGRRPFFLKMTSSPPLKHEQITFDNQVHSGRIKVNLENDVNVDECREWKVTGARTFARAEVLEVCHLLFLDTFIYLIIISVA